MTKSMSENDNNQAKDSRTLVYDLVTRLFHWFFAFVFLISFFIAKALDDDSPLYPYHMLGGIILSSLVIMRIFWGLVGTKHARFSSFKLNPMDLLSYFKGIATGEKKLWPGHNPASSWAAILMFFFTFGLAFSGFQMVNSGNKELYIEIHEVFAHGFILTVLLHIAGVILHTLRHKDPIALSMINGSKLGISRSEGIENQQTFAGVVFLTLFVGFSFFVFKSYDSQTQTLHLFGNSLMLGENENEGGHEKTHGDKNSRGESKGKKEHDDNDDD